MKIEEYHKITDETAVYPESVNNFGLAYLYLGLIGEVEELFSLFDKDKQVRMQEFINEFGDIIWYATSIYKLLNIDVKEIDNAYNNKFDIDPTTDIDINILSISQDIKKFYRDNKPIDIERVKLVISDVICSCRDVLFKSNNNELIELDDVLDINFKKLSERKKENKIKGDGDIR